MLHDLDVVHYQEGLTPERWRNSFIEFPQYVFIAKKMFDEEIWPNLLSMWHSNRSFRANLRNEDTGSEKKTRWEFWLELDFNGKKSADIAYAKNILYVIIFV